jgi:hypothetical protein
MRVNALGHIGQGGLCLLSCRLRRDNSMTPNSEARPLTCPVALQHRISDKPGWHESERESGQLDIRDLRASCRWVGVNQRSQFIDGDFGELNGSTVPRALYFIAITSRGSNGAPGWMIVRRTT